MHEILTATQTTGDSWLASGSDSTVLLDQHAGGEWVMQVQSPLGNWINTDITFAGNGIKDFSTIQGVAYRLHGGDAGAVAWAAPVIG